MKAKLDAIFTDITKELLTEKFGSEAAKKYSHSPQTVGLIHLLMLPIYFIEKLWKFSVNKIGNDIYTKPQMEAEHKPRGWAIVRGIAKIPVRILGIPYNVSADMAQVIRNKANLIITNDYNSINQGSELTSQDEKLGLAASIIFYAFIGNYIFLTLARKYSNIKLINFIGKNNIIAYSAIGGLAGLFSTMCVFANEKLDKKHIDPIECITSSVMITVSSAVVAAVSYSAVKSIKILFEIAKTHKKPDAYSTLLLGITVATLSGLAITGTIIATKRGNNTAKKVPMLNKKQKKSVSFRFNDT